MAVRIKSDLSVWRKLKRNFDKTNSIEGKLGWFGENRYGPENSNEQMAQVAKWVEEGHVGGGWVDPSDITPPRPVMRVGLAEAFKVGYNKDSFEAMARDVMKGHSVLTFLNKSDGPFRETLRNTMTAWFDPPNSAMTVDLKGFDDPWIETGELRDNVNFKVGKVE